MGHPYTLLGFPGSCPYLDGVLGQSYREVSAEILDFFKETRETLEKGEMRSEGLEDGRGEVGEIGEQRRMHGRVS